MTVPEQPSPRFEINPLPARGDPAGWEGRSPPPRRPSRPRPRAPIGASRPEPPANQAAGTALGARLRRGVGGKVQQLFFFSFPPPAPNTPSPGCSWGMRFGPPGARGLRPGRLRCRPARMHSPAPGTPAGTTAPCISRVHYRAAHHLPHGSQKLVCRGRRLTTGAHARWARGSWPRRESSGVGRRRRRRRKVENPPSQCRAPAGRLPSRGLPPLLPFLRLVVFPLFPLFFRPPSLGQLGRGLSGSSRRPAGLGGALVQSPRSCRRGNRGPGRPGCLAGARAVRARVRLPRRPRRGAFLLFSGRGGPAREPRRSPCCPSAELGAPIHRRFGWSPSPCSLASLSSSKAPVHGLPGHSRARESPAQPCSAGRAHSPDRSRRAGLLGAGAAVLQRPTQGRGSLPRGEPPWAAGGGRPDG